MQQHSGCLLLLSRLPENRFFTENAKNLINRVEFSWQMIDFSANVGYNYKLQTAKEGLRSARAIEKSVVLFSLTISWTARREW